MQGQIQTLADAQILYKPSKELLKFIKSLKPSLDSDNDEMPPGVANICSTKKSSAKTNQKSKLVEHAMILETSDIEILNSLDLDLDEHVDLNNVNVADPSEIKKSDKLLNFEDLLWLHKYIERHNESTQPPSDKSLEQIYFHQLFKGSEIILPKNVEVPRNEELEARCVKLRNQQDNRVYKSMTKNVDSVRQYMPEDSIAFQMKQINTQLIAVFQFIVSVLTGFMFGFLGIELMVGELDFGFRLLLGIICALIIALAELYFLAKKLNEDLDADFKNTTVTSLHENSKVKVKDD